MHTKSKKSQLLLTLYNSQMRPSHELGGVLDWFMSLRVVYVYPPIELLSLFSGYPRFILNAIDLDNVPEKNWLFLYFAFYHNFDKRL